MQVFWFIHLPGFHEILYPGENFLLTVHLYLYSHLLRAYFVMSHQMAVKIQLHFEQEFLVQSIYMHTYQAVEISVKALYLPRKAEGCRHPLEQHLTAFFSNTLMEDRSEMLLEGNVYNLQLFSACIGFSRLSKLV